MNDEKTMDVLSLDDLIADDSDKAEVRKDPPQYGPVSVTDIAPATDIKSDQKNAEAEVAGQILNDGILPKLEQIKETKNQAVQQIIQDEMDAIDAEELEEIDSNNTSNNSITMSTNSYRDEESELFEDDEESYTFGDKDLEALEKELEGTDTDDTTTEDFTEEQIQKLRADIQKYVKPVTKEIDISKFTISNTEVPATRALMIASSSMTNKNVTAADWVLVETGRIISMKPFDSDDIEKLERINFRTQANSLRDVWSLIYDHCVDENKPDNMYAWLKTISAADISHIYAAIFKASFAGNSYIPYECKNNECRRTFIPGETPFEDFVKYNTPECKAYVKNIMDKNILTGEFAETTMLQVSDDIVIELCRPSIYSVIFENVGLDVNTRTKFEDLLNVINYIKDIYCIDRQTNQLLRVKPKTIIGDNVKAIKAKLLAYGKIFKTFNSDQRGLINGKINTLLTEAKYNVTYAYPTVECPECKHPAGGDDVDPATLLFTRHRLTALLK